MAPKLTRSSHFRSVVISSNSSLSLGSRSASSLFIRLVLVIAICGIANLQVRAQQIDTQDSAGLSCPARKAPIFRVEGIYEVGKYSDSIAVGDFNADGRLDVVVTNEEDYPSTGGHVSVLMGKGNGRLRRAVQYFAGNGAAHSVAVADFNRDGKDDMVVASLCTFDTDTAYCEAHPMMSVDGAFPDYGIQWLPWPFSVAVGDFNLDGKPDYAVVQYYGDMYSGGGAAVSVFINGGSSVFATGGFYGYSVAVGDLNHDGKPDLVVANGCTDKSCVAHSVSVLLGNGDGTFQTPVSYISATSGGWYDRQLVLADFNADGKLDVATTAGVMLDNGDGTLQPEIAHAGSGALAAADFNGDGKIDLATTGGLLLGNGDGTFTGPTSDPIGGRALASGDFNRDGKPDLVVNDGRRVTLLLNVTRGFRHATATSVKSFGNHAQPGELVTFTATVIPAFGREVTGLVYFSDGDILLGSAPISGRQSSFETSSLSTGTHSIRASYGGDTKFLPSISIPLREMIRP